MSLKSSKRSENRGQSGAAASEFAILAMVLMVCLFGVVQFGSILYLHTNMENAAREAARRMAVNAASPVQAEQVARNYLANWSLSFNVSAVEPDPADPADTDVSVTISVPIADAGIVRFPVSLGGGTLAATVSMRQES